LVRATGRKSIKETEASVNAFILPRLGDEEVPTLTAARLRKWLAEIAALPPRLRTRPGRQQNVRDTSGDPETGGSCELYGGLAIRRCGGGGQDHIS
jgi:hypothetical protein